MPSNHISLELLNSYKDESGRTITLLSSERPLLLVSLRHFG